MSTAFTVCGDDGKPFCRPVDRSTPYVGKPCYVFWNLKFFHDMKSTIQVKLQWVDDSAAQAWPYGDIRNGWVRD
jgi:hypothetical protein